MEWLFEKIRNGVSWLKDNVSRWAFYGLFTVAGVILTWLTYHYAPLFSDFGLVIVFLVIFFGFFELFDRKILSGFDTIYELKGEGKEDGQGNVAVAQFCIAIALLVVAAAIIIG